MQSTIVDINGKPFNLNQLTKGIEEAQTTGVRSVWNHPSVAGGLTPSKLAEVITNAKAGDMYEFLTLAEEMEERDLHYGSVLGTRKRAIEGLPIQVESTDDSEAAKKQTEAVEALIEDANFNVLIEGLLDGLAKGFAAIQVKWHVANNQLSPIQYKQWDQRSFKVDAKNGHTLFLQDGDKKEGKQIPPFQFVIYRMKHRGLPIAGSLARLAMVAYMCKSFSLSDWMAYAELFGMPIRIGKYHSGATPEEKATLRRAVANIGSDASAIMPKEMDIELIERKAGVNGSDVYKSLCEWLDKQLSKGILGQTMTTEDGASQSQATIHNEVRMDILASDAKAIEACINRDLIKPFIDFNFGKQSAYPKFSFVIDEAEDLVAWTENVTKFIDRGLKVSSREIREKLGLSEPDDETDILGAAASENEPASNKALNKQESHNHEHNVIDNLLDEYMPAAEVEQQELLNAILTRIDNAIKAGLSIDYMIENWQEWTAGLPINELTESFARAIFKARIEGESND